MSGWIQATMQQNTIYFSNTSPLMHLQACHPGAEGTFGRSVNPISTKGGGADYAYQYCNNGIPVFSGLPTVLTFTGELVLLFFGGKFKF